MKNALEAAKHAAMNRTLPPDLFSGLLAIAVDAVIALDHEQRIIFFNEGAERIFGWSASEVVGEYLEVLLPERFRAVHRGHVRGFGEAHGRARLMAERQQISGLRKSGEEFPAEAAIQRLVVEGRDVYAAVLRDISARQKAEDELRQAITARDEMMGIVSHDLRNPASAVKMLARSILETDVARNLPDDVVERVAVIRQAAEQIDTLIQDLLDISRIEAGRLAIHPQEVNVAALVDQTLDALRPIAADVTLSADLPADLPTLRADPDRLVQLLGNLLGNAIKFTPAGGSASLRVHRESDMLVFTVHDTGPGIEAANLPHVFERYYQAPGSGVRPTRHGAGLGLPIARGIVEAHGGTISLASSPGAGTTVRFTLPITGPRTD